MVLGTHPPSLVLSPLGGFFFRHRMVPNWPWATTGAIPRTGFQEVLPCTDRVQLLDVLFLYTGTYDGADSARSCPQSMAPLNFFHVAAVESTPDIDGCPQDHLSFPALSLVLLLTVFHVSSAQKMAMSCRVGLSILWPLPFSMRWCVAFGPSDHDSHHA